MKPSLHNLFQIREAHLRLVEEIEEADGELTPELESALQIKEKELQEVAVSYAGLVLSWKGMADTIEKEIKRLQAMKARVEKMQEIFKDQIAGAMNQFRVDSISTPTMRLSFRQGTSVVVEDERLIPTDYFKTPPAVVSKELIKEAIKGGKTVPGASLATKKHLQIT